MVRNVFISAFLDEFGRAALSGEYHISRCPGEFVIPEVVVGFWCHKPAAERFKQNHLAAFFTDLINDFHRTHMINSGIQPNFVHEHEIICLGRRIEFLHRVADVRSRDHVFFIGNAILGHFNMHVRRKHRDDNGCALYFNMALRFVENIECNRGGIGMVAGFALRELERQIADGEV